METRQERSWKRNLLLATRQPGVFTKHAFENKITDERRSRELIRQQLVRLNHRTTVPRVRRIKLRDTKISRMEKFLPSFPDSKGFPTRYEPFEGTEEVSAPRALSRGGRRSGVHWSWTMTLVSRVHFPPRRSTPRAWIVSNIEIYPLYIYISYISRHVIEDFLEANLGWCTVDDLRRKRSLTRARNLAGLLLRYRRPWRNNVCDDEADDDLSHDAASTRAGHATLTRRPTHTGIVVVSTRWPSRRIRWSSASRRVYTWTRGVLQEAAKNTSVRELFAKRTDDPGGWFAGDVVPPRVRFPDGHAPRTTGLEGGCFYSCYSRRCIYRREGGCQGVPSFFLFLLFFCLFPSSFPSLFLSFLPLTPFFSLVTSPLVILFPFFSFFSFFYSSQPGHSARPTFANDQTRAPVSISTLCIARILVQRGNVLLLLRLPLEWKRGKENQVERGE